jgi:hypothetical protein
MNTNIKIMLSLMFLIVLVSPVYADWVITTKGEPGILTIDENGYSHWGNLAIKDTNMIKTYTNYPAEMGGDWLVFTLAVFIFLIGLLLLFSTVIEYTKRR